MTCGQSSGVLVCGLSEDNHREHLSITYDESGRPVYHEWPNEDFVDPAAERTRLAEQAESARQTVKTAVRTMRGVERRLARLEGPDNAKDAAAVYVAALAHTTRLGKVARHLLDNVGLWIDAIDFADVEIGGFAGTRRLRELREEYGWEIETRRKPGSAVAWQHRLAVLPPTTA